MLDTNETPAAAPLSLCSGCGTPAHASETDDNDKCASCRSADVCAASRALASQYAEDGIAEATPVTIDLIAAHSTTVHVELIAEAYVRDHVLAHGDAPASLDVAVWLDGAESSVSVTVHADASGHLWPSCERVRARAVVGLSDGHERVPMQPQLAAPRTYEVMTLAEARAELEAVSDHVKVWTRPNSSWRTLYVNDKAGRKLAEVWSSGAGYVQCDSVWRAVSAVMSACQQEVA